MTPQQLELLMSLKNKDIKPLSERNFDYQGQTIPALDVEYGILGKESTWGQNTTPKYEPKYHTKMKKSYETEDWIPTPAEKRIIEERGFDEATKQFSTSYGPYQILPETAYRYTSFSGNPEDLEDLGVSKQVYTELMNNFHSKTKGNLGNFIGKWNQNPQYLLDLINLIKQKNKR